MKIKYRYSTRYMPISIPVSIPPRHFLFKQVN